MQLQQNFEMGQITQLMAPGDIHIGAILCKQLLAPGDIFKMMVELPEGSGDLWYLAFNSLQLL